VFIPIFAIELAPVKAGVIDAIAIPDFCDVDFAVTGP